MALAGKFSPGINKKPKILLYVPDIEPGLALKVVARIADKITVTAEHTKRYFQKNKLVSVVGYPTRQELITFSNMTNRKHVACKIFDLSVELPTLLVFGGSKGARSINRALMGILPELLREMQVIHICGELDWQENRENSNKIKNELASDIAQRYRIFPYLHEEMAAALACSDIVVSRAGASILGEFPLFGLPAILVPYPYAWQYQYVNAQYLEAQHGAVVINDTELSEKLLPEIHKLIQNPNDLEEMRTAMYKLAKPDPAMKIVEIIQNMSTDSAAEV
jgi:UDP-N-acetylglucosamine--N-acetylmuramyl-(pentapeptide) pyrophosphoryl-undecaprenol N-acetylglucosamine transferase